MASKYKVVVPNTVSQVQESLDQIFKSRTHVASITVDDSVNAIVVRLDGKAHFFGYDDMEIPLATGKSAEAKHLIERLSKQINGGHPATGADAQALFSMLQH
jgi:hypothetical protein